MTPASAVGIGQTARGRPWPVIGAAFALALFASPAFADPQILLKDAMRQLQAGDTRTALRTLRSCLADPNAREWMIEESVKLFTAYYRNPGDSAAARAFFSQALRGDPPQAGSALPAILTHLLDYPALPGDDKLSVLSDMKVSGKFADDVLNVQIQLLRRMGRHDSALELAARLAQRTGQVEHRVLVVDLLLDMSRSPDALALGNSILNDLAPDPAAYSLLAERFYRHGDYRNALAIHRRARIAFSNPMLFFDQSLSICQGLQLSREGIELYLPLLLDGPAVVPEFYRDFVGMIADTAFLTGEYPAMIARGRNPNLFLAALFRFADIASDSDCLDFARLYRSTFHLHMAHIDLAELLLDRARRFPFLSLLNDLPDTPIELAESKKLLLFKNALRSQGPDRALEQFAPATFSMPSVRASVHRQVAQAYSAQSRLTEAIRALKAAQDLAGEPADHLRLARMYFLLGGSDSEALASAHQAHRLQQSDETLYWLGWLSYLWQDTETARKAFRDVVLRPESFLADESLTWMVAMGRKNSPAPQAIGRILRAAMRDRQEEIDEENLPVAVQIALRREAIRAGAAGKSLSSGQSAFLRYLRWEALLAKDRTDAEYQKLLRESPEHLRALIRTEEP